MDDYGKKRSQQLQGPRHQEPKENLFSRCWCLDEAAIATSQYYVTPFKRNF